MQIKTYIEKGTQFVQQLGDVRFVGQVIFVIIVLLISWSGIKTIQANYVLQKQITALRQQNDLQRLRNENLALQNEYFNSNQYLEVAARQNFGLGAPGEKLVVVPEKVALAHTIDLPEPESEKDEAKPPLYQRNIESWVDFFLHRQTDQ